MKTMDRTQLMISRAIKTSNAPLTPERERSLLVNAFLLLLASTRLADAVGGGSQLKPDVVGPFVDRLTDLLKLTEATTAFVQKQTEQSAYLLQKQIDEPPQATQRVVLRNTLFEADVDEHRRLRLRGHTWFETQNWTPESARSVPPDPSLERLGLLTILLERPAVSCRKDRHETE